MGQFSWLCADCGQQILSEGEDWECFKCETEHHGVERVALLIPEEFGGFALEEDNYEGYGEFGGMDAYALLGRMNMPQNCPSMLTPTGKVKTGQSFIDALIDCDEEIMGKERHIGIDLFFGNRGRGNTKYPIKIVHARCGIGSYENEEASEDDPEQGWQSNKREEGSLTLCDECGCW